MMQVNVNQIMAQLEALEKATCSAGTTSISSNTAEANQHTETKNLSNGQEIVDDSSVPIHVASSSLKSEPNDILQEAISKSGLEGKAELDSPVSKYPNGF